MLSVRQNLSGLLVQQTKDCNVIEITSNTESSEKNNKYKSYCLVCLIRLLHCLDLVLDSLSSPSSNELKTFIDKYHRERNKNNHKPFPETQRHNPKHIS